MDDETVLDEEFRDRFDEDDGEFYDPEIDDDIAGEWDWEEAAV